MTTSNRSQQSNDVSAYISRAFQEITNITNINNTTIIRLTQNEENVANVQNEVSVIQDVGSVNYVGTWNATTGLTNDNIALATGGVGGVKGDYYVVNNTGALTVDGISTWVVGDWIIHNGVVWQKNNNSGSGGGGGGGDVVSVNNVLPVVGNVTLTSDNINNTSAIFTSGGSINITARVNIIDNAGVTTATLPNSPTNGTEISIINYGLGRVNIVGSVGDYIESVGNTSISLINKFEKITFMYVSHSGIDIWNIN